MRGFGVSGPVNRQNGLCRSRLRGSTASIRLKKSGRESRFDGTKLSSLCNTVPRNES